MPRHAAVSGDVVWQLDAVDFRHPGARACALSEVTLEIPAGRGKALLGPNRAGRTPPLPLLSGVGVPLGERAWWCVPRAATSGA
ncbi:MAG: hypothetical protein IBJ19_19625, partial [Gemmatimonadaceae bacterium]|nr:hypothetical protein [Gemmatimonadaceae bacterium]